MYLSMLTRTAAEVTHDDSCASRAFVRQLINSGMSLILLLRAKARLPRTRY